jgi:hypothetical protein
MVCQQYLIGCISSITNCKICSSSVGWVTIKFFLDPKVSKVTCFFTPISNVLSPEVEPGRFHCNSLFIVMQSLKNKTYISFVFCTLKINLLSLDNNYII